MKLEILLNLGDDLPPYREGQVVDESEHIGAGLIRLGVAREIKGELTAEMPPAGASVSAANEDAKQLKQKAKAKTSDER